MKECDCCATARPCVDGYTVGPGGLETAACHVCQGVPDDECDECAELTHLGRPQGAGKGHVSHTGGQ